MIYGFHIAVAVVAGGCDAHRDLPDMGMKIGDVLCTDGSIMGYERYEVSGKEAIAVVFHIDSDEGNGVRLCCLPQGYPSGDVCG